MVTSEDQGPRRRRNSITIAILQRSHETASEFILCSEGDYRDFKHAINGYQNEAISSPIFIDLTAPGTSGFLQNIDKINIIGNKTGKYRSRTEFVVQKLKSAKSMQHIDHVNIIRGRNIKIGPTIEIFTKALDASGSTDNMDNSQIIKAVQEMKISGNIQNIENVNIFEGEGITIGTTIQTITQRIEPAERIIEPTNLTELESDTIKPKKRNRVRYFIAVFVCFTVAVGCAILFQVVFFVRGCGNQSVSPPYVQLPYWWYKCRWSWKAEVPTNITYLDLPVHNVVIGHSESHYCEEEDACIEEVQAMQISDKIERLRVDIRPNYIMTPNALLFEGRGASVKGAMLSKYENNEQAITIMFLGDYERNQTCSEQFEHLDILLTELVKGEVLVRNYRIFGECQVSEKPIVSPGPNVMNHLRLNNHWHSGKTEGCVKHENLENKQAIAQTKYG